MDRDEIEKKAQQTGKKPASVSDPDPTDEELQKGFDSLPKIPQNEGI